MTTDPWRAVGVDWAAGNWIAVGYPDDGPAETAVFDDVDALWDAHGADADRVVVDVPIGLCGSLAATDPCCVERDGELSRRCDDLARAVLGPRSSSVFTAPCREATHLAADGAPYAEVNETNRDRTGKGLSRQAANIAAPIAAVDDLLRGRGDPAVLVEGHPEVCFRAFADRHLAHGKRTAAGVDERLTALETGTDYDPGTWRRLAAALARDGHDPAVDDLLDALALAETAKAADAAFHRLPPDPPTDPAGLPMQMVYRRREAFGVV